MSADRFDKGKIRDAARAIAGAVDSIRGGDTPTSAREYKLADPETREYIRRRIKDIGDKVRSGSDYHEPMSMLHVVVGGQFGSEGKGAVAAAIAANYRRAPDPAPLCLVRVGGPNAGHTAYTPAPDRRKFALRVLPAAVLTAPDDAIIVLGPGSEIDPVLLHQEIALLRRETNIEVANRLYVSGQATTLQPHYAEMEVDLNRRIGSTGKGIGVARQERIARIAQLYGQGEYGDHGTTVEALGARISWPGKVVDTSNLLHEMMTHTGAHVIVEGCQGYGLGLHAGYYPYCTSIDCTAWDMLCLAGIPPSWSFLMQTYICYRPNPIRVAGNSGPLHGETTWDELQQEPEYTTVTGKLRRVGSWDTQLAAAAARANGAGPNRQNCVAALTMLDKVVPSCRGYTVAASLPRAAWVWIERVEEATGCRVAYVGTGPDTHIWLDQSARQMHANQLLTGKEPA